MQGGKISKLPLDNPEELVTTLRRIMLQVGIRGHNTPTDEETGFLLQFIISHYGGHTLAELELAFTMANLRELDLEEDQIPCYENFSIAYVARVMAAYRFWASRKESELVKVALLPAAPTEELTSEAMDRWMEETRAKVQANETYPELLSLDLFNHALATGMITKDQLDFYTPFALEKAVARREAFLQIAAKDDRSQEPALRAFLAMKQEGCYVFQEVEILQNLSYRLILWKILGGKKV